MTITIQILLPQSSTPVTTPGALPVITPVISASGSSTYSANNTDLAAFGLSESMINQYCYNNSPNGYEPSSSDSLNVTVNIITEGSPTLSSQRVVSTVSSQTNNNQNSDVGTFSAMMTVSEENTLSNSWTESWGLTYDAGIEYSLKGFGNVSASISYTQNFEVGGESSQTISMSTSGTVSEELPGNSWNEFLLDAAVYNLIGTVNYSATLSGSISMQYIAKHPAPGIPTTVTHTYQISDIQSNFGTPTTIQSSVQVNAGVYSDFEVTTTLAQSPCLTSDQFSAVQAERHHKHHKHHKHNKHNKHQNHDDHHDHHKHHENLKAAN